MALPDFPDPGTLLICPPFESSNVAQLAYDSVAEELLVQFKSGKWYVYPDVSADGWRHACAAQSKGRFVAELKRQRAGRALADEDARVSAIAREAQNGRGGG